MFHLAPSPRSSPVKGEDASAHRHEVRQTWPSQVWPGVKDRQFCWEFPSLLTNGSSRFVHFQNFPLFESEHRVSRTASEISSLSPVEPQRPRFGCVLLKLETSWKSPALVTNHLAPPAHGFCLLIAGNRLKLKHTSCRSAAGHAHERLVL